MAQDFNPIDTMPSDGPLSPSGMPVAQEIRQGSLAQAIDQAEVEQAAQDLAPETPKKPNYLMWALVGFAVFYLGREFKVF